jgi:large subunit ribosomal protein L9
MEVVLRTDVDSLGLRGEVVNVARGYARNYLLPRGLAELATPALQRELLKREAQRARHEAKTVDEAQAIATRLEALELRFDVNAGPTGSLFGSVTATDVADRLWADAKIRVDRRKLKLDTIKRIGRYTVPLELFSDVTVGLKLVVAPEGQELPSDDELAATATAQAAAAAAEAEVAAAEHELAQEAVVQAVVEAELAEDAANETEAASDDDVEEPSDEPDALTPETLTPDS